MGTENGRITSDELFRKAGNDGNPRTLYFLGLAYYEAKVGI